MTVDPGGQSLLERFSSRAQTALLDDRWEIGREDPAREGSIFLGDFQKPLVPDFVATVEFILESGPMVRGFVGAQRTSHVAAVVGGEFGVRHLPTAELLKALGVRCETNISLDIEEVFEAAGLSLPVIHDERSAEDAARVLVEAVGTYGVPFADKHSTVETMLRFVEEGGQTTRDDMFEAFFVPTMLAASGRSPEAEAALASYRPRLTHDEEQEEFVDFADRLTALLH